MDEKHFTTSQIVKVADKYRRDLERQRIGGFITEAEEHQQAAIITGIIQELGLFYEYAFYHTQDAVDINS